MRLISEGFFCFTTGLVNVNNSLAAAEVNMLATSKSCGNIRCFDQHYQPGKMTWLDGTFLLLVTAVAEILIEKSGSMCGKKSSLSKRGMLLILRPEIF